jgi:hypothetical protein
MVQTKEGGAGRTDAFVSSPMVMCERLLPLTLLFVQSDEWEDCSDATY